MLKWHLIPALFILHDSSSFWTFLHFPLSGVPPLTVAIDFGDKQPSKSHRMLPEISKLHDGLRQIAIYICPWMSFVTAYWCLYQKAGCKTGINWDKWADQWRSKFVPYSRSNCSPVQGAKGVFFIELFFETEQIALYLCLWRAFPSHGSPWSHCPESWSGFSMSSPGLLNVW